MTDSEIVELFLRRDQAAITACASKYGSRLSAIAMGALGDEGSAEECVNDAYLEAWSRIPPHEPRDYLFAFLAKIVRAKALNRVKFLSAAKRSAELVSLTDELSDMLKSGDDTEDAADAAALADSVNRYLRSASDDKRRVFVRRYWYMESIAEIAGRYRMSESKVKSLLLRARRELEKQLKREGIIL